MIFSYYIFFDKYGTRDESSINSRTAISESDLETATGKLTQLATVTQLPAQKATKLFP